MCPSILSTSNQPLGLPVLLNPSQRPGSHSQSFWPDPFSTKVLSYSVLRGCDKSLAKVKREGKGHYVSQAPAGQGRRTGRKLEARTMEECCLLACILHQSSWSATFLTHSMTTCQGPGTWKSRCHRTSCYPPTQSRTQKRGRFSQPQSTADASSI